MKKSLQEKIDKREALLAAIRKAKESGQDLDDVINAQRSETNGTTDESPESKIGSIAGQISSLAASIQNGESAVVQDDFVPEDNFDADNEGDFVPGSDSSAQIEEEGEKKSAHKD